MKPDNPFDRMINHCPIKIKDAAIYVVDTLDLSYCAAKAIFEEKATPEIALEIYDRICAEVKERNLSSDDFEEE